MSCLRSSSSRFVCQLTMGSFTWSMGPFAPPLHAARLAVGECLRHFDVAFTHFREVVTERAPNRSDLASAAATLRLTSEIAERIDGAR